MTGPPRRWLSGFGAQDWGGDDRGYASLLDALTRDRLETEVLEREISAPAHFIRVDWPKLRTLAQSQGHPLPW